MENEKIVVRDTTVDQAISKGLAQLNLGSHEVDIKIISEGKKGLFGFGQKDAEVELTPKILPDMDEPGDIAIFESEERADYLAEKAEKGTGAAEEDGYVYSETLEYAEEDDEYEEDGDFDEEPVSESTHQDAVASVIAYLKKTVEVYGAPAEVRAEEKHNLITFHIDTDKPGLIIGKHGKIINALQILAQTIYQQHERSRVSVVVNVGDYRERREKILENIADRTAERVLRTKQPVFLEPLPAFERKQIHAHLSKNKRISTHSEGKEPHRYLVVEIAE